MLQCYSRSHILQTGHTSAQADYKEIHLCIQESCHTLSTLIGVGDLGLVHWKGVYLIKNTGSDLPFSH
jgi:hypothetical protein